MKDRSRHARSLAFCHVPARPAGPRFAEGEGTQRGSAPCRKAGGVGRGLRLPFAAPQEPAPESRIPPRRVAAGVCHFGSVTAEELGARDRDPADVEDWLGRRSGEEGFGPRRPPWTRRPVPMTTAGNRDWLLACAAAMAHWTLCGAGSASALGPEGAGAAAGWVEGAGVLGPRWPGSG